MNKSFYELREPLTDGRKYSSPTPFNESSPACRRPTYLPPYRFDHDECELNNVYLLNDEAYMSVCKILLSTYDSHKTIAPSEVIDNVISKYDRKMFADAHIERSINVSTFAERGEPPILAFTRQIERIFGSILLEYYASADGQYPAPVNDKKCTDGNYEAMNVDISRNDFYDEQARDDTPCSRCKNPNEEANDYHKTYQDRDMTDMNSNSENNYIHYAKDEKSTENESHHIHNDELQKYNPLYIDTHDHNVPNYQNGIRKSPRSPKLEKSPKSNQILKEKYVRENQIDKSSKSRDSEANKQAAKSKLRQQLLKEIKEARDVLRSTSNKKEKLIYKRYIKKLLTDLDVIQYNDPSEHHELSCDEELEFEDINIQYTHIESPCSKNYDIGDKYDQRMFVQKPKSSYDHKAGDIPTSEIAVVDQHKEAAPDVIFVQDTMNDYYSSFEYEMPESDIKHTKGQLKKSQKSSSNKEKTNGFVDLIAPMDLPGCYMYTVRYGKKTFVAKVPPDGVKRGECFKTPLLIGPSEDLKHTIEYEHALETMNIPRGKWREGLFSCVKDPLLAMAVCFPHAALHQINSRMQILTHNETEKIYTVKSLLLLTFGWVAIHIWVVISLCWIFQKPALWLILVSVIPLALIDIILIFIFMITVIKTRTQIREKYNIDGNRWNDSFISICCTCCAISQMGTHTADYNTYRDSFFAETGLPKRLNVLSPKRMMIEERV